MAFRVEQTERARQDLDAVLEWLLAHEAGDAGLRWFRRMREAILSLSEFPLRCSLAPENAEFPFEVRQLIFGKKPHQYRILFSVADGPVTVLHIRHGRRRRVDEPH
jgi:plasmid stabilization system protein ParE